jgi:hypothetical protein
MRLLVVTARYPTPDRPAAGSFVRDRLHDPALFATVIAPRHYARPGWLRALQLLWGALTRRGRFDGVEGHFVLPSGPIALLAARIRRLPLAGATRRTRCGCGGRQLGRHGGPGP